MKRIKKVVLVQTDMLDIYDEYPTLTLKKLKPLPPLGLCYIATALEEIGCEVVIVDNYVESLEDEELSRKIIGLNPDMVGFSVTAINVFSVGPVSKLIKSEIHDVTIICGGPHTTIMPSDVGKIDDVDYLVIGEGEITITELVNFIRHGGTKPESIKGIMYRDKDKSMKYSGGRPLLDNLDQLAVPNRKYLDLSKYMREGTTKKTNVMAVSSSRGCPFQCAFCSSSPYWDKRFRARSAVNVVDEIEQLVTEFGAEGIYFREDVFTLDKQRLKDFCEEMQRRNLHHIPWECETRVDTVNYKQLEMMKKSGCKSTWVGIESGSPRILKQIFKRITVEQVKTFFANCNSLEIDAGAHFMLGFPDETYEDIMQSVQLGKEIKPTRASYQIFVAYPDSPLYRYVVENGMTRRKWGTIFEIVPKYFTPDELLKIERKVNFEVRSHIKGNKIAGISLPVIGSFYNYTKPYLVEIMGQRSYDRIDDLTRRVMHSLRNIGKK